MLLGVVRTKENVFVTWSILVPRKINRQNISILIKILRIKNINVNETYSWCEKEFLLLNRNIFIKYASCKIVILKIYSNSSKYSDSSSTKQFVTEVMN